MYPLILSAIMTSSIYLLHALTHRKQKYYVYIILFIGLAAVDYFIDYTWKANACELRTHMLIRSQADHHKKTKTRLEVHQDYLKKCDLQQEYHREQAIACYEDVERLCDRLTNIDDKEKSKMLLKSSIAAASPATPTFRIIAAAMLLLEEYFSERWDEMQLFQVKLLQAQSHAEMYEHYRLTRAYVKDQIALEPKGSATIIFGE
jgi:hypothetical protein